ncbi:hypothetical protein AAFP30_23385 [Gordonia sp. CPCC 205515]|uniref:hypothetical protein n=1 Tax=Gordonia sp. CPCC 205515 TaxID=3140791 RepID=UPI003AF35952
MSQPDQPPRPGPAPVPGPPRPGPQMMPRTSGGAPGVGSEVSPDSVTENVAELVGQVDEIRRATGDTFDLPALARQTELLEQAHDTLTSALENVDPR